MSIFVIATLSLVVLIFLTVRTVRRDGYGHSNPPRSHEAWTYGSLPSTPYLSVR